jgi:hypothetical protein
MPPWLVPLLPLIGVIVGVAAQFVTSRSQEAERQRRALRTAAYVDYLRGVSASARAMKDGDKAEQTKAQGLVADARARMCVYGGAAMLRALADLVRCGDNLATPEGMAAFLAVSEVMRAESGHEVVSREDLAAILFGEGRPRGGEVGAS